MSDGPAGLRYNVNVAFSTAYGILDEAQKVTDRRKAFLYVSSGYDLNPFKDSRYKAEQERYGIASEVGERKVCFVGPGPAVHDQLITVVDF